LLAARLTAINDTLGELCDPVREVAILTQVNTSDNAKFQGGSQVVGLQDGGYLVVWQDESGNYNPPFGDTIVGQRYDSAGNKVGGEVQLSQLPPLGLQFSPAVAVLSNGNIAVAYVDLRGSPPDRDIHVSIFDSALNFIRFDDIDVAGNPKQTYEPSLTALAGGGYVVSYTVGTGDSPGTISDTDIVARIVSANGTVGNQFDIDNQNAIRTSRRSQPWPTAISWWSIRTSPTETRPTSTSSTPSASQTAPQRAMGSYLGQMTAGWRSILMLPRCATAASSWCGPTTPIPP
jgi:hypothetical protein